MNIMRRNERVATASMRRPVSTPRRLHAAFMLAVWHTSKTKQPGRGRALHWLLSKSDTFRGARYS